MDYEKKLFEILANKYSRKIFSLTSKKEYSANQLNQELEIPLATVYRKLKHLEAAGLIKHVKTVINLQGNEEKFYRCPIKSVTIYVHDGMLSVDIKKEDQSDKIVRLWKRLSHPNIKPNSQNEK